jgi:hypothetical protein
MSHHSIFEGFECNDTLTAVDAVCGPWQIVLAVHLAGDEVRLFLRSRESARKLIADLEAAMDRLDGTIIAEKIDGRWRDVSDDLPGVSGPADLEEITPQAVGQEHEWRTSRLNAYELMHECLACHLTQGGTSDELPKYGCPGNVLHIDADTIQSAYEAHELGGSN